MTGAAAASLLTGCSSEEPGGRRTSGSAPDSARTEAALRRRLAAASGELRDQYDAAIAQHPSLARKLTDMREAVAEHAKALGGSPGVAAAAAPGDPGAALKALGVAERRTSDVYTTALADAEPELARLLASVAAAGAAHAYLLSKGDS